MTHSSWQIALSSDATGAQSARTDLAGTHWYPLYAFFRASGADAEGATTLTQSVLAQFVEEPVADSPLLRERLLELARALVADPVPRDPLLTVDGAWAEQRFATEGTHTPEETFVRRWTMDLLERAIAGVAAEYEAAGKSEVFAATQPFLGYSGGAEGTEPYTDLAARLGLSDGAARTAVFEVRKRYRELLLAAIRDTVATEEEVAEELQALLIKLPAPAETVAPSPALGRLDPEQLLARGMNSVQMSTAGGLGWSPPTIAEAARLFPGYEVVGMLGHGGMGAVYQARQQSLDRLVALKLLPLEISVDPSFADRFRREARAMAKLNHPNIIAVHDFGQTSEGHLFFAMEFVEGASLHALVHKREGGLPTTEALGIIEQVCDALGYAHEQGIVHRDIKPANVMIDPRGRAKIADFGLARINDPAAEQWGQTMTGMIMGTPDYMAPEQKRGMQVDSRADIYSAGVMFYEMLCGETPQGAFELPSQRRGLPKEIDTIITRAIAPQVEKRYQTTTEFKQAVATARPSVLRAVARKNQTGQTRPGVTATPGAPAAPVRAVAVPAAVPAKKSLGLWIGVGVGALVIIVAAFAMMGGKKKPAPIASTQKPSPPTESAEKPKPTPQAAAPKAAPSAPIPAAASVAAGNEQWVDGLAQWFGGTKTHDAYVREDNSGARVGAKNWTALTPLSPSAPAFHDQVVRVRWHPTNDEGKLLVLLRRSADASGLTGEYRTTIHHRPEKWVVRLGFTEPGKPYTDLGDGDLPPDFEANKTHTIEFRVVRDLLTVAVDGKRINELRDSKIAAGHPAISGNDAVIESFEYANLDPAAPAPALAAAQPEPVLTFGGHRYQVVNQPGVTLSAAKARAESMGGHLATITSKEEDGYLCNLRDVVAAQRNARFFLGARYESVGQGGWVWFTGEPFTYSANVGDRYTTQGAGLTLSNEGGPAKWTSYRDAESKTSVAQWIKGFIVEWDDDGTTKPATIAAAAPPGKAVDLLAGVDVQRDSLFRPWRMEGGSLKGPLNPGSHETIMLAVPSIPASYDVRYRVKREQAGFSLKFYFVQGDGGGFVNIDGSSREGAMAIVGLGETVRADHGGERWFTPGTTRDVLLQVRESSIAVVIDGREILRQDGHASINGQQMDGAANPPALQKPPFIGMNYCGGEIAVSEVTLLPIASAATPAGTGGLAVTAPAAPEPAPAKVPTEMEKWLAQIDGPQQEGYQRDVVKPFEAGLAELQKGYLTAVESRITAASTAGQLDVALGWRNELQRFREAGQGVPADDDDAAAVAAPLVAKALPPLRTQFRAQKAKLDADRLARAKVAFAKYDAVLAPNITLLTQRQRLDDALLLKTKRDEVQKAWLPVVEAPAAPPPATPATPAPKPLGANTTATPTPAPNSKAATNAAIRAAVEWIIAHGGNFDLPRRTTIRKVEDIPAGPFVVESVGLFLKAPVPEADVHLLKALSGVKNMGIDGWDLPDSGFAFLDAFGDLDSLQFRACPKITDALLEALPAMPNLKKLTFAYCQGMTGTGLTKLKAPQLSDIDLTGSPATDKALAAISRHERLRVVRLEGSVITDAGMANLEHLRGLIHLGLQGTAVTPAALTFLGKRKEFTHLNYLNAAAPDFVAKAQAIAKIFPNLPELEMSGKASGPEATRALLGFKSLRVLQWGGSEMNDATFGELAALTDLEDLVCQGAHLTDAAMDSVLALKKLTRLVISGNPDLTDAGLLKLKPLKKLKAVHFSGAKATDAGAAELEKAIPGVKIYH